MCRRFSRVSIAALAVALCATFVTPEAGAEPLHADSETPVREFGSGWLRSPEEHRSWRYGPLQRRLEAGTERLALPPIPAPWEAFALRNPGAFSAMAGVAQDRPPATWSDFIPNLLLMGAIAGVQFGVEPPKDPRWASRNSFDAGARRAFRGGSRGTREGAEVASDVLLAGLGAALLADWWWLRDEHGLVRSVQIDSQWFMASYLTTRVAKVAAGRERPYVRPCRRDDDYVSSCGGGRDRNGGFFSGHGSSSAMLAGTLCARHLNRAERSVADILVCTGAAATSVTTGFLRMTAEQHFMTDVVAGWAIGAVFGYVLPTWFDYGNGPGGPLSVTALSPEIGRDYYGVRYAFRF